MSKHFFVKKDKTKSIRNKFHQIAVMILTHHVQNMRINALPLPFQQLMKTNRMQQRMLLAKHSLLRRSDPLCSIHNRQQTCWGSHFSSIINNNIHAPPTSRRAPFHSVKIKESAQQNQWSMHHRTIQRDSLSLTLDNCRMQ